MAIERWVVNASPLILLGKVDHLDLLFALTERVIVPQAVADEVHAKPDGIQIVETLTRHDRCVIVGNETASADLLAWDLGAGETQVIANAQRNGADRVVIDDLQARRCAKAMGFKVIGTLGVVARAKRLGHIQWAAPIIERLRETGLYVSEDLVQRILTEIGES
jgi:predicted nucleic acid-binding protein